MNIAPFTLAKGAMPTITRLIRDGFDIDPIDAHYYYPDAVPAYVEAFDIALQPAVTSYASPLKLMEYLVLGKGIVARRMENLLEILTDGQNATMFDNSAPGAPAEACTELCRDHDLHHRLSVTL